MANNDSIARYRSNLQGEVDSAALYRAMAEAEPDPHLAVEQHRERHCAERQRDAPRRDQAHAPRRHGWSDSDAATSWRRRR